MKVILEIDLHDRRTQRQLTTLLKYRVPADWPHAKKLVADPQQPRQHRLRQRAVAEYLCEVVLHVMD